MVDFCGKKLPPFEIRIRFLLESANGSMYFKSLYNIIWENCFHWERRGIPIVFPATL
jgi:hypothetical protein